MLNSTDIRKVCNEKGIRMIDFKMTDLDGRWRHITIPVEMLMYGKEASNRKQEIDRQHYTIPNQRPKDKHCGKI